MKQSTILRIIAVAYLVFCAAVLASYLGVVPTIFIISMNVGFRLLTVANDTKN